MHLTFCVLYSVTLYVPCLNFPATFRNTYVYRDQCLLYTSCIVQAECASSMMAVFACYLNFANDSFCYIIILLTMIYGKISRKR